MSDGYILSFLFLSFLFCLAAMCGGGNKQKTEKNYQTISCSTPSGWKQYEVSHIIYGKNWRFKTQSGVRVVASHCFQGGK